MQRQLYRMKWSHLRPFQVEAIHTIRGTLAPVLLSAATASGKTEAAFLPILSAIAPLYSTTSPTSDSVRVLYVGPLRALINDQFARLESLCELLEIPVHRWHGDVGAAAKRRLVEHPGGILLLTPESLESLFVNRAPQLRAIFHQLEFVVIDELHVFLGTERGRQLQSLLGRLEPLSDKVIRRVGLSATIGTSSSSSGATAESSPSSLVRDGEPTQAALQSEVACRFLAPANPQDVLWIEDDTQKPMGYRVHCYLETESGTDAVAPETSQSDDGTVDEDELATERLIAGDVARHFSGRTSLVFANARGDVEAFADLCQGLMPNEVLVHHGSLARDIREEAEDKLKARQKNRAVTAFCSSTLELGIDLGDVEAVGQIGPPPSVASLKQRLGRSGRGEGQKRELRVYLTLREAGAGDGVFDRLHLPLLQTIAATQLLLEGWVEPPQEAACDLSTLTQQIISVIAQTGGLPASDLYRRLCVDGAFRAIEPALFARLLRCLGATDNDIIEQTPTGDLILGLKGEFLQKKRDFYAVFLTPQEYALSHQGHLLGKLPILWPPPMPGDHLLFAGRRWQILELDADRHQIFVVPARGKKRPHFEGERIEVHTHLRERMREVLQSDDDYPYLDRIGRQALYRARQTARQSGLWAGPLLSLGEERTALLLWSGDRLDASLRLLLVASGVALDVTASQRGVGLVCRHPRTELLPLLEQAASLNIGPEELARLVPQKERRKYDPYLAEELLETGLARDYIDIEGAQRLLKRVLGTSLENC
jgi:ATP-dependent Lhr-like helicase